MHPATSLTRRGLLTGGATLLGASLAPAGVSSAPIPSARALTILGPNDPSFRSTLDKLFPGLSADKHFEAILPSVFLVSNPGNKNVKAFTAEWHIFTPTGGFQARLHHLNRPAHKSSVVGKIARVEINKAGTTKVPRQTGRYSVLRGDDTKLLSPFFLWAPSRYRQPTASRWKAILQQDSLRHFMALEIAGSSSVSLEINTVIYKDGHLTGSANDKLVHYFSVTRNAQHDAAYQISLLLAKNVSADGIKEALLPHANTYGLPRSNWRKAAYLKARAAATVHYLNKIKGNDLSALARAIQRPLTTPKATATLLRS